jgi:hypothetical protein
MMRKNSFWAAALLVAASGAWLAAQDAHTTQLKVGGGGSPHMRGEWTVHGAKISIEYGSPFLKGRTVGNEVAPFGKVWRTGADEATTIVSDKPLTFGALVVPAGTHTIYTLPNENQWQLIISKTTGQWGIPYPEGDDLGRVPMKVGKRAAPVENLRYAIDETPAGGTLRIEWGTTSAAIDFTVGM